MGRTNVGKSMLLNGILQQSAPSSAPSPAPPATPWTRSSTTGTARWSSSTPPGCAAAVRWSGASRSSASSGPWARWTAATSPSSSSTPPSWPRLKTPTSPVSLGRCAGHHRGGQQVGPPGQPELLRPNGGRGGSSAAAPLHALRAYPLHLRAEPGRADRVDGHGPRPLGRAPQDCHRARPAVHAGRRHGRPAAALGEPPPGQRARINRVRQVGNKSSNLPLYRQQPATGTLHLPALLGEQDSRLLRFGTGRI